MIYNCHIHTFLEKDIPRRYLPLGLVRILATTPGFRTIGFFLNMLNPLTSNDQFKRYRKIIEIGRYKDQKEIFEECRKFYPSNSKFVVASMDMHYMNAGRVPRDYMTQLTELAELKKMFPEVVLPFVHLDPRRKDMMDILKRCMDDWQFSGIKIYPSLGYFPYDVRLMPMWEYANKNNVPVISHCSPYNPTYNRGWPYEIRALLSGSKIPLDIDTNKRKRLCSNFSNPLNFPFILDEFTNVRICLAHFGSEYYWERYLDFPEDKDSWFILIKDMMEKYDNLYSDISYTLNNPEFFPLLKVLLSDPALNKQILFGSDYYMVEYKATERRFGIDLRGYLGEDNFRMISYTNARRFLGQGL